MACRVGRSTAAGCSSGSTWARASGPSAASAADAARCGPAASAVATRTWARSAAMSASSAATPAPPKSPKAGVPSGRTTIREASNRRCATPRAWSRPRLAQMRFQELVVELAGIQPVQWAAGGLGHQQRVLLGGHPGGHHREHRHLGPLGQQRDEGLVLDLLAAAQRTRCGVSPRYHSADQAAASSWPSQASRPYTFTSNERPSGASAVAMATPRGSSGAWRSPQLRPPGRPGRRPPGQG